MSKFDLKSRRHYPWLFFALCVSLLAIVICLARWDIISADKYFDAVIAALGIAAGYTHFRYSQYLEQTTLFHELSREFSERYDELNGRLNNIRRKQGFADENSEEWEEELNCLYDYFNLCAEEYLYFNAGHIDPKVWIAWCVGMNDFAQIDAIKGVWVKELERPSYYGFDLEEVMETARLETERHKHAKRIVKR